LFLPFTRDFATIGQISLVFAVCKWFCNFWLDLACFCRLQVILLLYARFSLFLPFTSDFAVYKWICNFWLDLACFCRLQVIL
jgi:hypothetical protein